MSLVSEYIKQAVVVFLENNPNFKDQISSLTPKDAEFHGMPLEELRRDTSYNLFEEYAQSKNIHHVDLAIQMTVPSKERRIAILRDYHKNLAETLKIGWDDYLAIHSSHSYLEWVQSAE